MVNVLCQLDWAKGVEKGIGIEMGIRVKGNKNKTNTTPNQKGALGDQNNSVRN